MVLQGLYTQRTQILEIIYEITGISDLLRGNTKASETATAQQLKAQFGSMRMRKRQEEIERYIRDLFRIKSRNSSRTLRTRNATGYYKGIEG